ncbi:MAG: 30S ribosomal protein S2 [Minisyncoccia bacterium]
MVTHVQPEIQALFDAGLHYGYSRTRRHPSAQKFIYSQKNRNDIFELERTAEHLKAALEFVTHVYKNGGKVLFIGGKNEAREIVRSAAESCAMPYVSGRWIGGTLTNFKEIKKRVDRLEKHLADKESGALVKYTKRERLMIDREIDKLTEKFGGIMSMKERPQAVFIVDTKFEEDAVLEANDLGIPVIALANSDCDFSKIQYPIPGNDATNKSIAHVTQSIARALNASVK